MPSKKRKRPKTRRRVRKSGFLKLKPDDELVWDNVCRDLRNHFGSADEASAAAIARDRLVRAGCDERAILQNLYLYCGGDPKQMKLLRESYDFKGQRKRLLRSADSVRQLVATIQSTDKVLGDLGITCHFTPDISKLETYAHFLDRFACRAFRLLASKRVSGRDQHLAYLCRMVEVVTGRPHYDEIAELVYATRRLYGAHVKQVDTAETIRKRMIRYRGFLGLPLLDLDSEIELEEMHQAKP